MVINSLFIIKPIFVIIIRVIFCYFYQITTFIDVLAIQLKKFTRNFFLAANQIKEYLIKYRNYDEILVHEACERAKPRLEKADEDQEPTI